MTHAIENRRKLHRLDLEARCVLGGPDVEAELLARVDDHLRGQERLRELEAVFAGVGSAIGLGFLPDWGERP